jgi:coenzyme F420-dependent glucose-6-phosphate dehydrogenase
MGTIGYHASHEQFSPRDLVEYVQVAEGAGFSAAMCSDHFHPWSEDQGQSGFAWSWLGAAMQATKLSFGTVNAPGYRYHPAIVAQAAATLAVMFPGRFWLAVGSGEALNESVTGARWPAKDERNARLLECVEVIRALWRGEAVTHRGLVTVEGAKLYTRPQQPPMIVGAALTPETARWMGGWADALITVAGERGAVQRLLDAWREGGGGHKPIYCQSFQSWAPTEEDARRTAHLRWRHAPLGSSVLADLRSPAQFDAASRNISVDELAASMRISSDLQRHADWLRSDLDLGFERVYVHNPSSDQRRFIETFAEKVLPALAG